MTVTLVRTRAKAHGTCNFQTVICGKEERCKRLFEEETSWIARFLPSWRPISLARLVENPPRCAEGIHAVGGDSLNEYEGTAVIAEVDTDVHTRD
jgi:hypothetical protein